MNVLIRFYYLLAKVSVSLGNLPLNLYPLLVHPGTRCQDDLFCCVVPASPLYPAQDQQDEWESQALNSCPSPSWGSPSSWLSSDLLCLISSIRSCTSQPWRDLLKVIHNAARMPGFWKALNADVKELNLCINVAHDMQVSVCHAFRKSNCMSNVTNQPHRVCLLLSVQTEKRGFQSVSAALNFLRNVHTVMSFTAFEILHSA